MSKARAEDFKNTPGMRTEERMSRLREDAGRARREALQQLRTGPRDLAQPLPTGSHDLAQQLRTETAAGILRREAADDDFNSAMGDAANFPAPADNPDLFSAMQIEGRIVGDGSPCPEKKIPTKLLNGILTGISYALKYGLVTPPEAKEAILNFVYQYWEKVQAGLMDDESTRLLNDIYGSLGKGIRPGSMPSACISLATSIWNMSKYVGKEFIGKFIAHEWKDILAKYKLTKNERDIDYLTNELETEPRAIDISRLEDENRAALVTLLSLGFEVEDVTDDEMDQDDEFDEVDEVEALERQQRRKAERAIERAAKRREERRVAHEADDETEMEIGGKRRTRKHKKQMKHKKTKRHRKKTKKHLKKRNNKKQRKTRNRK